MKENKLIAIIISTIAAKLTISALIVFLIMHFVFRVDFRSPSQKMIEQYSDDDKYTNCNASLLCYFEAELFSIDNLISTDGKEIPNYRPDQIRVFSSSAKYVVDYLKTEVGNTISFKTSFGFYYPEWWGIDFLPVVQITVDGIEILKYEDGKKALLDFAYNFM